MAKKPFEPMSDDELHELLNATLHGPLPFDTAMRVLATLGKLQKENAELSQRIMDLEEELGHVNADMCPDCKVPSDSCIHT